MSSLRASPIIKPWMGYCHCPSAHSRQPLGSTLDFIKNALLHPMLLFMGPSSFHVAGYSFFLPFNGTTTSKTTFQMAGWENPNLSYEIIDQIIFFKWMWIRSNFLQYLVPNWIFSWFLMLRYNSNIALQFVLSNFVPHNDTCIKASKVSNFNEVRKWFLIAFFFNISIHKLQYLRKWQAQSAKVSWGVANWYATHWCPHKIVMHHTIQNFISTHVCDHIHWNIPKIVWDRIWKSSL